MIDGEVYDLPQSSSQSNGSKKHPSKSTHLVSGYGGREARGEGEGVRVLIRCLTLCHTLIKERDGAYRAESPDELALVEGLSLLFHLSFLSLSSLFPLSLFLPLSYLFPLFTSSLADHTLYFEGVSAYQCRVLMRTAKNMRVDLFGEKRWYEIILVNEFTSERKRMSILLRDKKSDEFLFLCKGADSVMVEMMSSSTIDASSPLSSLRSPL